MENNSIIIIIIIIIIDVSMLKWMIDSTQQRQ